MASWKAVQGTGQLKNKQAKKALSRSLKTSHDEVADAWIARRFKGGRRLTKGPRKGRRKGTKGGKKAHFRSVYEVQHKVKVNNQRKSEGAKRKKGKEPCIADWAKGKGKQNTKFKTKKGQKGRGYTAEEASVPESDAQMPRTNG